jgi:hypothetical protein
MADVKVTRCEWDSLQDTALALRALRMALRSRDPNTALQAAAAIVALHERDARACLDIRAGGPIVRVIGRGSEVADETLGGTPRPAAAPHMGSRMGARDPAGMLQRRNGLGVELDDAGSRVHDTVGMLATG